MDPDPGRPKWSSEQDKTKILEKCPHPESVTLDPKRWLKVQCIRIGKLPKALKRGILWLAAHTKRGRMAEVTDDVYDYARNRYFKVRLHLCSLDFYT